MERRGCVVVMERGAPWTCVSLAHTPGWEAASLVYEGPDEPVRRLIARVRERCAQLAEHGVRLDTTVLACSARDDEESSAARTRLSCALLSLLARGAGGRLLLAGDPRLPASSLRGLAEALSESLVGSGVTVEVCTRPAGCVPGLARTRPRRRDDSSTRNRSAARSVAPGTWPRAQFRAW